MRRANVLMLAVVLTCGGASLASCGDDSGPAVTGTTLAPTTTVAQTTTTAAEPTTTRP